jgi:hypothetical protein
LLLSKKDEEIAYLLSQLKQVKNEKERYRKLWEEEVAKRRNLKARVFGRSILVNAPVLEHILKKKRYARLVVISSKGLLLLTTPNAMYLPIFVGKILSTITS